MGIENILSKIINFVSQERGNKNNNIIFDYKKVSLLHKLEKKRHGFPRGVNTNYYLQLTIVLIIQKQKNIFRSNKAWL